MATTTSRPTTTPASRPTTSPTATAQPTYATPPSNQNQGLLIAAWITAFLFPLVGLILSIVGKSKGDPRFKVPMIISIVFLALGVIWTIFVVMAAASAATA